MLSSLSINLSLGTESLSSLQLHKIWYYITTRKRPLGTGWERPKAPVSQPVPRNRDHWPLLKTPGFSTGVLGFHWYRLEIPTGTKEASTLRKVAAPLVPVGISNRYQLPFPFFPNPGLFVIFITVYSFIFAKRTQTLQYYTFIGRSCSFSENIWN